MAETPAMTDNLKAALADIQQPPLPDEFYPAPGYLLLGVLLLALLGWFIWRLMQQRRRNSARRLALRLLAQINLQQKDAANQILLLLKQYLQTKKAGHPALAMHSSQFVVFLQQSGRLETAPPDLDILLYGPAADPAQVAIWHEFARQWLVQHKELALHV